jgi:hypothetical protein
MGPAGTASGDLRSESRASSFERRLMAEDDDDDDDDDGGGGGGPRRLDIGRWCRVEACCESFPAAVGEKVVSHDVRECEAGN